MPCDPEVFARLAVGAEFDTVRSWVMLLEPSPEAVSWTLYCFPAAARGTFSLADVPQDLVTSSVAEPSSVLPVTPTGGVTCHLQLTAFLPGVPPPPPVL